MKPFFYVLSAVAVMALAYWAYRENYRTHRVIKQADALRSQIVQARDSLAMLRAEWAYLNRPARLRDLAELNFSDLQLMPMTAARFGRADQVAYPAPGKFDIKGPVDVVGTRGTEKAK